MSTERPTPRSLERRKNGMHRLAVFFGALALCLGGCSSGATPPTRGHPEEYFVDIHTTCPEGSRIGKVVIKGSNYIFLPCIDPSTGTQVPNPNIGNIYPVKSAKFVHDPTEASGNVLVPVLCPDLSQPPYHGVMLSYPETNIGPETAYVSLAAGGCQVPDETASQSGNTPEGISSL